VAIPSKYCGRSKIFVECKMDYNLSATKPKLWKLSWAPLASYSGPLVAPTSPYCLEIGMGGDVLVAGQHIMRAIRILYCIVSLTWLYIV